ncbi:HdeD family acid-resistance protein [Colwellia piezophila]|uniref:HdeD family acid-resistance protein n=1 Tax=Colwellia piezophila TaxID=211668 RepID=UPI000360D3DB|nr:HdeD family acid-resistance protein [Colwellia piezophila]
MDTLLKLLKNNAKLHVAGGITLSLIGVLCISLPFLSGLTIANFISLTMVAAGLTISIFAFSKEKTHHKVLSFISGIFVTLLGVFMFINPVANLYALAMIAVSYFIVDGISGLISTYEGRKNKGWGWMLFSAIISLVLAGLLISQWPLSSFYIVGTLVGVRFIFTGFNLVLLAATGFGFVNAITDINEENEITLKNSQSNNTVKVDNTSTSAQTV